MPLGLLDFANCYNWFEGCLAEKLLNIEEVETMQIGHVKAIRQDKAGDLVRTSVARQKLAQDSAAFVIFVVDARTCSHYFS